MLSEMQSKCGVRGRTEPNECVNLMNGNESPREGRPKGLRRGGKMAKRQLLDSSHHGRREVGGGK